MVKFNDGSSTRRQHYTQTLLRDPRWRGPYLAVALLIGLQAAPSGDGRTFRVSQNATALRMERRGIHQVIRALTEQGYLTWTSDEVTGHSSYRLDALRPSIEMDERKPGARVAAWDERGPASDWLFEESSLWAQFQAERERAWEQQAELDPELWQHGAYAEAQR